MAEPSILETWFKQTHTLVNILIHPILDKVMNIEGGSTNFKEGTVENHIKNLNHVILYLGIWKFIHFFNIKGNLTMIERLKMDSLSRWDD